MIFGKRCSIVLAVIVKMRRGCYHTCIQTRARMRCVNRQRARRPIIQCRWRMTLCRSSKLNRIAKKFDIQVTEKSRTGPEDKCITNPLGYLEDLEQFENMGNALNCLEDLRRFESTVLSNFEDSRIIEKPCNCDEDVEIEITALTGKELLADNCAVGDVRPAEQLPLVVKNNDRRNVLAWSRCAARNRSNGPSAFPISHPGALGPSGSLPDGRFYAW
mmetsp:Transcript_8573/g.25406  ORF Transcript_8573/g.25406 Transcript_8573/m.25406 type:complete len:217 (+) Transcript_8573:614-1264(+)